MATGAPVSERNLLVFVFRLNTSAAKLLAE
jgi:hypothetical protein